MATFTIQPSFSGGEFSPSLYSRVDVAKYNTGLKKARNAIVHPHGGVSNRAGLEFVCEAKVSAKKVRLIPFEYSIDQSYILEFNEGFMRVIKDGGLVISSGVTVYSLAIPYLEVDLASIKFTQSVDVLYLFHPNYPTKTLTRLASNNWVLADFVFSNGPFFPAVKDINDFVMNSPAPISNYNMPNGYAITGQTLVLNSPTPYFQAGQVGSLIKINSKVGGGSVQVITSNLSVPTTQLTIKGAWRIVTSGSWGGTLSILKSNPANYVGWQVVKTISHNSNDANIDAYGTEEEVCRYAVGMDYWGGGSCSVNISCDYLPYSGVVKITAVTDSQHATGVVTAPFGTWEALSWQEGSWSSIKGYPSCGAFFQDRLAMAATPNEPQTTWFSKTGNYGDFGTSSPLQDTDAISVNLPSRKMNGIKNMIAMSEVLTFTSASEIGIGQSGGIFAPTTAKTNVYGYRGSNSTDPVIVGNRVIIVQAMGSVVRDFGYDFTANGFAGADLSIFSTHLLKGLSITEMAYQQEPDSLVWCIRSDGKALSMTYMKEQDVVAWSWHDTDGLFESVVSIPGNGQNDVYFVINRNGKRYVERLTRRLPIIDSKEAFFLDSALTYRGASTTTISGLAHLEGKTVSALSDGRVVKNLLVTAGVITLPVAATLVHVGLPYISDFQTLNIQVPMPDGVSTGRFIKVSEARFNFLNSRGGFIGPDENNLDEIIDLSPAILSDPKDLFTGEYKQMMASGYEEGGSIFYRQVDPLPFTILSVMPKITVGG
jgi:hypothetical protein